MKADAAETAIHILCILPDVPEATFLRDRLAMAATRPEPKELRQTAEACRRNAVQDLREDAARFDYLAAVGGCRDAARQVAVEAIARTERPGVPDDDMTPSPAPREKRLPAQQASLRAWADRAAGQLRCLG